MQIHRCSFSTECIPNIKRKIILVVYRTCFNPVCVPQRTASKRHLGLHGEHSTFGNIFPVSLVKRGETYCVGLLQSRLKHCTFWSPESETFCVTALIHTATYCSHLGNMPPWECWHSWWQMAWASGEPSRRLQYIAGSENHFVQQRWCL